MITGAVTKNGLGIEFTSTKSYLVSLYNCISTLVDEHFLSQIGFPEQHSDFILCLAYDIRKAYEGKRGVTVLFEIDEHETDFAMYSNRVLWPTFIIQVSMLKYLATASKNLASIKLIENLEKCAFDALHEVSPSTSSYIDAWFNEVVIDGLTSPSIYKRSHLLLSMIRPNHKKVELMSCPNIWKSWIQIQPITKSSQQPF